MTKLRITFLAAMASAVVATSFFVSFDSAQAFPREGMRGSRHIGHVHRGHRGHFHRRHGGWGHVGTGVAIGLGAAIIGHAIAAAQEEPSPRMIVRKRIKRAVQKKPIRKGPPPMTAQQKRDCELRKAWEDLVKSAEDLLARDIELNKKYGDAVHSPEHIKFQEQELDRRREELKRAIERCPNPV
jgi:hypothetical protein